MLKIIPSLSSPPFKNFNNPHSHNNINSTTILVNTVLWYIKIYPSYYGNIPIVHEKHIRHEYLKSSQYFKFIICKIFW